MTIKPANPLDTGSFRFADGWSRASTASTNYHFHRFEGGMWDVWIDSKMEFERFFIDRRSRSVSFRSLGQLSDSWSTADESHNEKILDRLEEMYENVQRTEYSHVLVIRGKPEGKILNGQYCSYEDMRVLAIFKTPRVARRGHHFYSKIYLDAATHGRKNPHLKGGYTNQYTVFKRERFWWDPPAWHSLRWHYLLNVLQGGHSKRYDIHREYSDADERQKSRIRADLYKHVGEPTLSSCARRKRGQIYFARD